MDRLKLLSGYYRFPPRVNYHYIGIGTAPDASFVANPTYGDYSFRVDSLHNIMATLNHPYIDVLKIDVEGSEYSVIRALAAKGMPRIGHLLVEVHLSEQWSPNQEWPDVVRMVELIEAAGFRLVHNEPLWSGGGMDGANTRTGGVEDMTELSFMHRDWVADVSSRLDGCEYDAA